MLSEGTLQMMRLIAFAASSPSVLVPDSEQLILADGGRRFLSPRPGVARRQLRRGDRDVLRVICGQRCPCVPHRPYCNEGMPGPAYSRQAISVATAAAS